jgi:hypothetical protein
LWILDVGGTRLVILVGNPGIMSAEDQTDVDRILTSIKMVNSHCLLICP